MQSSQMVTTNNSTPRNTVAPKSSPVRQEELVTVAARLFRERGYDATSMKEIADEMGILKGSVYHYVRTKEDLLWMVVEPPLRGLVEQARGLLSAPDRSVKQRLADATMAHAGSFEVHYPHMFVITRENGETLSPARRREFDAMRSEYMRLWVEAVQSGIDNGELRDDLNPRVAVHAIFGMLNWMFRWFVPDRSLDAQDIAVGFADIFTRGVTS
jgi:AcrR family transcriptional regulator